MGFRTTIILFNDHASTWEKDTQLGRKIMLGGSQAMGGDAVDLDGFGRIVECSHADTQRLAVIDSYSMETLSLGHWIRIESQEQRDLKLLRDAAERLGYRLVKKAAR